MIITETTTAQQSITADEALDFDPKDIRGAAVAWRAIKDYLDARAREDEPYKEAMNRFEGFINRQLTIPEGERKSETISIPGVGTFYKKAQVSARVTDWESWRKYLVRNGYGAVIRQQNNLAPLEELHERILLGELPMPQSAEFTTFEKLSKRKA